MKKSIFTFLFAGLLLASCGGSKTVEVKLDKYDLTMQAAEGKKAPEFKESTLDGKLGRYDMNIGKRRINFDEIEERIYPENVDALKEAVSSGEDFKEFVDGEKHPNGIINMSNGAFGVVYSEGSKKNYLVYYSKGGRYFRITPVFNSDLEDLDEQLAAYESIK